MKHLDLFSGIGGFALAASWVWGKDHEIHSFVEIEPFCQKELNKHWPNVPINDDIRPYEHDGTAIDILTGGFPCQPFSQAGKRRGAEDDRALWPYMLEVIQASRPTWVIGENVAGFINMGLDDSISDLEGSGYEVQSFIIPACAKDAPHRRYRVWILAHHDSSCSGGYEEHKVCAGRDTTELCTNVFSNSNRTRCEQQRWAEPTQKEHQAVECGNRWCAEPRVGRVVNGLPHRVDRLKSLGNAIVPQVAVPIMEAIKSL